MTMTYTGELAALGTVFCWTIGSQCFEAAGKRIGSLSANLIRLIIAFLLFCVTLAFTRNEIIPSDFPVSAWKWLIISGIIGFTLGDMCLFSAFIRIGPRLSMLIMTLTAPITALIGWLFLDEIYTGRQWKGVLVTLIGVSWVVLQSNGNSPQKNKHPAKPSEREITWQGLMLGFGGAVGQAIGFSLSKVGMMNGNTFLDPFAATQVRVIGGTFGFIVLFFLLGWWPHVIKSMKNMPALGYATAGSFLGPYLGVSLSLLALHYTSTGVASTIISLVPVTLIPFAIFLHKEHVSIRGFGGTLIAVYGVIMLIN